MGRLGGWFLLFGGGIAAYLLYQWEKTHASLPGAVGSLPQNPNLPPGTAGQIGLGTNPTAAAIGVSVPVNDALQQTGSLVFDPESDVGSSPVRAPQTEAAYNQGANSMGNPTGPSENQNDDTGLDAMFFGGA
jgi:hypothetical protein